MKCFHLHGFVDKRILEGWARIPGKASEGRQVTKGDHRRILGSGGSILCHHCGNGYVTLFSCQSAQSSVHYKEEIFLGAILNINF